MKLYIVEVAVANITEGVAVAAVGVFVEDVDFDKIGIVVDLKWLRFC